MQLMTRSQREVYTKLYRRAMDDSPVQAGRNAQKTIGRFAREVPEGGVYLGIGAGRGATEGPIYRTTSLRHLNVLLVDIAKRRSVLSSRRFPRVLNIEADAHALPVRDESVDLAACIMSQDFYDNRSLATREAHRVLKPNGKLVLFLHHPEMFRRGMAEHSEAVQEFWQKLLREKRVFSHEAEIREFYTRHGFEVDHVEEKSKGDDYWWEIILRKLEKKR